MKYAVLSGNERFEIREGELKSNGCAVLQVTHVGVCGTDTSYWHEGERYRGVVIGHEYSGVVVAPGTNRALKPGDRVAGYTQNVFQEPCGHCEACLAGDWDHCTNRRVFTWKGGELGHPGAYSQYTTWFPHSLVKLPDNVTNEEGAMAEPFAVGLHAIQVSQVKPNDRVLILGGGIIGMSCAEWARTFGASEITVSELNPQKREIIRGYQVADHVVAADAPDLEQQLLDISTPACAPSSRSSICGPPPWACPMLSSLWTMSGWCSSRCSSVAARATTSMNSRPSSTPWPLAGSP